MVSWNQRSKNMKSYGLNGFAELVAWNCWKQAFSYVFISVFTLKTINFFNFSDLWDHETLTKTNMFLMFNALCSTKPCKTISQCFELVWWPRRPKHDKPAHRSPHAPDMTQLDVIERPNASTPENKSLRCAKNETRRRRRGALWRWAKALKN